MLTAALQDLLTFLSKMPDLSFSKPYLDEFFNRTNSLPAETTLANYQAIYPFKNEKKFYLYHHINISNYLSRWPTLIQKLEQLLGYIKLASRDYLQRQLPMDDLLPLFIFIMPQDKAVLTTIIPKLLTAVNINKHTAIDFSFSLIYSAALFSIEKSESEKQEVAEAAENAIAQLLISKLDNPSYFNGLTLLLEIDTTIKDRLCTIIKQIYSHLYELNVHDYDMESRDGSSAIVTIGNIEKIVLLTENTHNPPIADHKELLNLLEKFKAFYDIYITINHGESHSITKLTSIANKLQFFAGLLQDDYKEMNLASTESLRHYLQIPSKNWLSLFSDPTISLAELMPYFQAKSATFEEALEKERVPLSIPTTSL